LGVRYAGRALKLSVGSSAEKAKKDCALRLSNTKNNKIRVKTILH
jgi:hypothetical protein